MLHSNSRLIRVSKSQPCELCLHDHGCSYDTENEARFCLRTRGDTEDFKYQQEAGDFGMYFPKTKKDTKAAAAYTKKFARKHPNEFLSRLEPEVLAKHLTKVFDLSTGDVYLNEIHRDDLRKRGLTDAQIDAHGYFSLKKWQRVKGADKYCPGFNSQGVFTQEDCMIVPARNIENQIVGYQLKMDSGDCRYKWALAYEGGKSNPLNSSHLKYGEKGELPLTLARNKNCSSNTVYLSEGTLKPAIASEKLKHNVIGASGGNFIASSGQLNELLEELKPDCVAYLLDENTLLNKHVYPKVLKQLEHIKGLPAAKYFGDAVYFVSWGQLEAPKGSKLDCDEVYLSHYVRNRKFLTIEEFKARLQELNPTELKDTNVAIINGLYRFATTDVRSDGLRKFNHSYLKRKNQIPFISGIDSKITSAKSVLTFKPEERTAIYQAVIASHYKYILDTSGTGSGKSYHTGLMKPTDFITNKGYHPDRIFQASPQHRNPTTTTLEDNYAAMPTKNDGLHLKTESYTPRGKPVYMRMPQGSGIMSAGNCSYFARQNAMSNANVKKSFCKKCPLVSKCSKESVPGSHGYLFEVAQTLANHDRIRLHPSGINVKHIQENDILIVDEVGKSVEFVSQIRVNSLLVKKCQDRCSQLGYHFAAEALDKILILMTDSSVADGTQKLYGYTKQEVAEKTGVFDSAFVHVAAALGEIEEQENTELINQGGEPRLAFAFELFRALSGIDENYSFTLHKDLITIYTRNDQILDAINAFSVSIFQDATMTRELLAKSLRVEPDEILHICEEEPVTLNQNVVIHQIQAVGTVGALRSSEIVRKNKIIRDFLDGKYGTGKHGVGYIDKKAYASSGDLIHHADARGSNAFEHKKAICIFGMANPNMSAAKAEFEVLYGVKLDLETEAEFNRFYAQKVQAETLQETGRIRANRRSEEQLDLFFVTSADLSFLMEHNFKIVQVSGYEIHPDLDNNVDRFVRALLCHAATNNIGNLSIRKLEKITGVPKSCIGRYLQDGFFDDVPAASFDADTTEKIKIIIDSIQNDPELLPYYLGVMLRRTTDPDLRKLVVNSTLKTLAAIKIRTKKILLREKEIIARCSAEAERNGLILTSYNIASIEKTLI